MRLVRINNTSGMYRSSRGRVESVVDLLQISSFKSFSAMCRDALLVVITYEFDSYAAAAVHRRPPWAAISTEGAYASSR